MFGKKKPEPAEEEIIIKEEPIIETKPVVEEKKEVKPAGTFIAEGVTLVGNFETSDDFEIKGTVRGIIISDKAMHIDSTGALYGDAKVESLYVEGEVEGSLIVEAESVITGTGKLKGNLATATFRTDPGSAFEGNLKLEVPKKAQTPVYEEPAAEPVFEAPVVEEVPAEAPAFEIPVYEAPKTAGPQDYDAIFSAPVEPKAEKNLREFTLE